MVEESPDQMFETTLAASPRISQAASKRCPNMQEVLWCVN